MKATKIATIWIEQDVNNTSSILQCVCTYSYHLHFKLFWPPSFQHQLQEAEERELTLKSKLQKQDDSVPISAIYIVHIVHFVQSQQLVGWYQKTNWSDWSPRNPQDLNMCGRMTWCASQAAAYLDVAFSHKHPCPIFTCAGFSPCFQAYLESFHAESEMTDLRWSWYPFPSLCPSASSDALPVR